MRKTENFNSAWRFILEDNAEYACTEYNDSMWRLLDLPHDWSIENELKEDAKTGGGGGYAVEGTAWYRKHFAVEDLTTDDIKLVAKCNILLTGLSSGLLFSIASMP